MLNDILFLTLPYVRSFSFKGHRIKNKLTALTNAWRALEIGSECENGFAQL
jgi:hypothetical protein